MDLDSKLPVPSPASNSTPWLHTPEVLAKAAETRALTRAAQVADRNELAVVLREQVSERLLWLIEKTFSDTDRGCRTRQIELIKWMTQRAYGKVPTEIILDTEDSSFEAVMRKIADQQMQKKSAVTATVVDDEDIEDTTVQEG